MSQCGFTPLSASGWRLHEIGFRKREEYVRYASPLPSLHLVASAYYHTTVQYARGPYDSRYTSGVTVPWLEECDASCEDFPIWCSARASLWLMLWRVRGLRARDLTEPPHAIYI